MSGLSSPHLRGDHPLTLILMKFKVQILWLYITNKTIKCQKNVKKVKKKLTLNKLAK